MMSDYPHFLHVCGGCGLRVSQTNECPGPKTCPNVRRDATPSPQNMRQNDNGSWSLAKPIKMSLGWRIRMWFHR